MTMTVKERIVASELVMSQDDEEVVKFYERQAESLLSTYRVPPQTIHHLVDSLLDAGRLMGAQQAVRRHEAAELREVEKVKAFVLKNRKEMNIKDMNN